MKKVLIRSTQLLLYIAFQTSYAGNGNSSEIQKETHPEISTCNHAFSRPALRITYVDNRKLCCYCKSRNSECSPVSNAKDLEEITYLSECLQFHFNEINASEEHEKNDLKRLSEFIQSNYHDDPEDVILPFLPPMFMIGIPIRALQGKKIGSTDRVVDRYSVSSDFCSPKCKDDCMESRYCGCD